MMESITSMSIETVALLVAITGVCTFAVGNYFAGAEKRKADAFVQSRDEDSPSAVRDQHILCLVNPKSGNGFGKKACESVIKPMFRSAGADLTVLETTHASHLFDLGNSMAEQFISSGSIEYDCVMICGGDGSLREFLSGIIWKSSRGTMELDAASRKVLYGIPVALIPLGSSNGIAISCGHETAYSACESIILNTNKGGGDLDLWKVSIQESKDDATIRTVYDIHCLSSGAIAHIDQMTESTLRWMGKYLKIVAAAVYALLFRAGQFSGSVYFLADEKHSTMSQDEQKKLGISSLEGLEEVEELPGWKKLSFDKYLTALSCNGRSGGSDIIMADDLRIGCGHSALQALDGNCSRFTFLRFMLSLDTGSHVQLKDVANYRATAVRFQFSGDSKQVISVSGEIFRANTATAEVQKGVVRFIY